MYRSSLLRSTLNTGYITGLDMCKVCTEAVHSVALWTRVTLQFWTCVKYVPKQSTPWTLWTRVTLQVWTCVKYVPKQSIAQRFEHVCKCKKMSSSPPHPIPCDVCAGDLGGKMCTCDSSLCARVTRKWRCAHVTPVCARGWLWLEKMMQNCACVYLWLQPDPAETPGRVVERCRWEGHDGTMLMEIKVSLTGWARWWWWWWRRRRRRRRRRRKRKRRRRRKRKRKRRRGTRQEHAAAVAAARSTTMTMAMTMGTVSIAIRHQDSVRYFWRLTFVESAMHLLPLAWFDNHGPRRSCKWQVLLSYSSDVMEIRWVGPSHFL